MAKTRIGFILLHLGRAYNYRLKATPNITKPSKQANLVKMVKKV